MLLEISPARDKIPVFPESRRNVSCAMSGRSSQDIEAWKINTVEEFFRKDMSKDTAGRGIDNKEDGGREDYVKVEDAAHGEQAEREGNITLIQDLKAQIEKEMKAQQEEEDRNVSAAEDVTRTDGKMTNDVKCETGGKGNQEHQREPPPIPWMLPGAAVLPGQGWTSERPLPPEPGLGTNVVSLIFIADRRWFYDVMKGKQGKGGAMWAWVWRTLGCAALRGEAAGEGAVKSSSHSSVGNQVKHFNSGVG
jgi:hypothetical protein